MSIRDQALDLLRAADRAYGVSTGRDALATALDDAEHGATFQEWAVKHLALPNLLSIDELTLYAALDQNGQVDHLAAAHDLSEVQPVTEDEIRLATEELRKSTMGIMKQTENLQQQQQALARLSQKSADNVSRRQDFESTQQRKLTAEHQSLMAEVGEIQEGLRLRLADLQQQDEDLSHRSQTAVESLLRSDDRLLESLRKLSEQMNQQDPGEAKDVEQLRNIGYRLIKTNVETTRTKLDRVYLESLTSAVHQHPIPSSLGELKELEEEVESLYSEILPVSQMSIEQQHMEPALNTVISRNGQDQHRTAAAVAYMSECLSHVIKKASFVQERVASVKTRQEVSFALNMFIDAELAAVTAPSQPSEREAPASPVRKKLPVHSDIQPKARRRSSIAYEESPFELLLGSLGIVAPEEGQPANEQLRYMQTNLFNRGRKWEDVRRDGQNSYEAVLSSHLEDVRSATQLLQDSVFAETAYSSEPRLVDAEFDGSIDDVVNEVNHLQSQMDRAIVASANSEKRQELISRFATH